LDKAEKGGRERIKPKKRGLGLGEFPKKWGSEGVFSKNENGSMTGKLAAILYTFSQNGANGYDFCSNGSNSCEKAQAGWVSFFFWLECGKPFII
jgi:hypothetical protein